jgi:hypothetical protein
VVRTDERPNDDSPGRRETCFGSALGSDKIGGLSLADPLQTGIELTHGH